MVALLLAYPSSSIYTGCLVSSIKCSGRQVHNIIGRITVFLLFFILLRWLHSGYRAGLARRRCCISMSSGSCRRSRSHSFKVCEIQWFLTSFHTTFIHLSLPFHLGRDATLTVFVPPERPIIINGDVLSTNEDREVEIKCVSRGGKPEPTVSVTDGLLSRVARCCCCCGKKAKKALKASKLPGQLLTEP